MTLTAPTTSTTADEALFGDVASADTWLVTTDHRRLATVQLGITLLMLLAASAVGVIVHGSFAEWWTLAGDLQGRWLSAQQNAIVTFGVLPLFAALAMLAVPREIGSRRLAFPRLAGLAVWSYVVAAVLFVVSYAIGDGPPLFNGLDANVPGAATAANRATDLLLASLLLAALSQLMWAVNIIATVITQRTAGLQVDRVRPFTWASFLAAGVSLLSVPVGMAGTFLVYLDQHFGASLFGQPGTSRVVAHGVWFLGRPEALLPMLLAFGLASDVVSARAQRPLIGGSAANWLLTVAAALTLTIWAFDDALVRSPIAPFGSWVVVLTAVPIGLLVLVWLGTLKDGLKADVSLLFVAGVVVAAVLGAALAVLAAWKGIDGESVGYAQIGYSSILVFVGPLLGAAAGVAEFTPIALGKRLPALPVGLAGLALIGATLLSASLLFPGLGDGSGISGANGVTAVAKVLLAGGVGLLLLTVIGAMSGVGHRIGDQELTGLSAAEESH